MEMQCENVEIQPPLNGLDAALNELGMLSTRTNSANEYQKELYNKKYLNMLTINTRYVSNVSIGFRVRPVTPHVRYKPYATPKERQRTRSENNDNDVAAIAKNIIMDELDNALEEITQLKKAKSLESIVADGGETVDLSNIKLEKPSELELVSDSIQNLKVAE